MASYLHPSIILYIFVSELTCMNLNTIIRIKLQTQLKVNDKLIAAALGSCLKISPTTINGIGPD
jgi:hypothetical protein